MGQQQSTIVSRRLGLWVPVGLMFFWHIILIYFVAGVQADLPPVAAGIEIALCMAATLIAVTVHGLYRIRGVRLEKLEADNRMLRRQMGRAVVETKPPKGNVYQSFIATAPQTNMRT